MCLTVQSIEHNDFKFFKFIIYLILFDWRVDNIARLTKSLSFMAKSVGLHLHGTYLISKSKSDIYPSDNKHQFSPNCPGIDSRLRVLQLT